MAFAQIELTHAELVWHFIEYFVVSCFLRLLTLFLSRGFFIDESLPKLLDALGYIL